MTYKSVSIEVFNATMFAHRYIFNDSVVMENRGREILKSSKVYFLCSMKRLRFDLTKTTADPTGILKCYLIVGEEMRPRVHVPMLPFLCAFQDADIVRSATWQVAKFAIDHTKSTPLELACEALLTGGEVMSFTMPVSGLLWMSDVDLETAFNILYIGQSFEQIKRLRKHEKMNEAASRLPDDEELCALSVEFELCILGAEVGSELWNLFTMSFERDSNQHRKLVNIIERVLINFIQPPLNKNLVDTKLTSDDDISRLLVANGARYITLGTGMKGQNWSFMRSDRPIPELVHYDLQNDAHGFVEGMPPFI